MTREARKRCLVRTASVILAAVAGCGGKSSADGPVDPARAVQGADAGSMDDSCSCPSSGPHAGDACACGGLTCDYGWNWCYSGEATCADDGRWRWPSRASCPAEPRLYAGCPGEEHCTYAVEAGCGPANLELSCTCVDAQWLLTYVVAPPPLCDCAAITTRGLCEIYSSDCAWSEDEQRCRAPR